MLYNVVYLGEVRWGNVTLKEAIHIVRQYRKRGMLATVETA